MQHRAQIQLDKQSDFTTLPYDILVLIINYIAAKKDARTIVMPLLLTNKKLYHIFKTREYSSRIKINLTSEASDTDIMGEFDKLKELLMANYFDYVRRHREIKLQVEKHENINLLGISDTNYLITALKKKYSDEVSTFSRRHSNLDYTVIACTPLLAFAAMVLTSKYTSLSWPQFIATCVSEYLVSAIASGIAYSVGEAHLNRIYNITDKKLGFFDNRQKELTLLDVLRSPNGKFFSTTSRSMSFSLPQLYKINDELVEQRDKKISNHLK